MLVLYHMEDIKSQDGWDKKKIIIALLILFFLGLGLKALLFDNKIIDFPLKDKVKGVSTASSPSPQSFNPQKILEQKLEGIKQEVQNLNFVDIASSSPQVKKILNDLKALEQYPINEVKELCQKICSSL